MTRRSGSDETLLPAGVIWRSRRKHGNECPGSALTTQPSSMEARVDADLDTLATALYVKDR